MDVVIRNKISGKIVIIDLKTATRGWTDFQKKDFNKKSQLLIYKKFYSELFDVPLDKIESSWTSVESFSFILELIFSIEIEQF